MEECIIETRAVEKTFRSGFFRKRRVRALDGIDLGIKKGEIFGILGPNGAGKTTYLNVLSTQLAPDAGEVRVFGKDLCKAGAAERREIRTRINMCSGNPNFPWSLSVREILVFYAMLYGLGGKERDEAVEYCIKTLELEKFASRIYDELSTGTKQRLALAKSLVNKPEILFLDEPTIGLDPDMARKIRVLIEQIHAERKITILLTTHYMKEAEQLCGRIAFIKDGKIRALGTSAELKTMTNAEDLEGVFLEFVN